MWSALVTPLARRTEKWWGSVMEVGLDPELTKWSVRPDPVIVLTGKGYKEYHWLVVPPINHSGYLHFSITSFTPSCQCPLAPSPEPKTNTVGVVPPFVFVVKPGIAPTQGGLSLPSCSTRKDTA